MDDNEQKKPGSRAGCVVGIVTILAMLLGLVLIVWSKRSEEHAPVFVISGVVIFMLPILAAFAMTLIPQKVRGVKESPKKERVFQNLMMLSAIMAFGGFLAAFASAYIENTALVIMFGVVAAVGFVSVIIVSAVHMRATGKSSMTIELFPTDPEQDKRDLEAAREIIGEVLKKEEKLSDEERERELRRIEEQDRITGSGMTREQVEEYENRKRF